MASVRRDDETGEYGVTSGNFAAVDAYEPGSVAKVITIASSLSEGVVTPETSYVVPWRKQYYDDLLKDSHQHPDEVMSVAQILVESSNIGTISSSRRWVANATVNTWRPSVSARRPALDFPGESAGILKDGRGSVGLRAGHRRLRPGRVEHLAAAGRGGQHDRQPGHVRRAETRQGDGRARRRCRRDRAIGDPPGRLRAGCGADDRDDAQRRVFRAPPREPRSTACRSPARPARRSRPPTTARTTTTTATGSTTPASSGSSRPRTRR